jgi:hypothetical protein
MSIAQKVGRYLKAKNEIIEAFGMGIESPDDHGINIIEGEWNGDLECDGIISGNTIPNGDLQIIFDNYSIKDGYVMVMAQNGIDAYHYYIFDMDKRKESVLS